MGKENSVKTSMPEMFVIVLERDDSRELKYGENPGRDAALYEPTIYRSTENGLVKYDLEGGLLTWERHSGPQLGWNNCREIAGVRKLLDGFDYDGCNPTVAFSKHGIVCGFGYAPTMLEAYKDAEDGNPFSDFGGIVGANRKIDMETADHIVAQGVRGYRELLGSVEGYDEGVVERILERVGRDINMFTFAEHSSFPYQILQVDGPFLVGEPTDLSAIVDRNIFTFPTEERPTKDDLELLVFANRIVKRVPSNGIVIGDGKVVDGEVERFSTYGVGTDTKRVGAVHMAGYVMTDEAMLKDQYLYLSQERIDHNNPILASDGFFPFADSIELAADLGVRAIITPGVSRKLKKEAEKCIRVANKNKIAMVFDNDRHFLH